ncbi:MAG: acyl carrier protein [Oscillospiraceae bacterium]|nr:acyl carrier protein [Oscillospiraceae bacterium]MCR5807716.1 acyl carrier protein [Oscillospiraceae bacterium]
MSTSEKIALIESCMDIEEGTLSLNDKLTDYEEWDSLTALSVFAAAEEKYDKMISGKAQEQVETVSDIVELMG